MARVDLRENEYIERFVGQDHIDSNDVQFWYQLLTCSFNFMRVKDPRMVEKTLDPYLVRLTLNNNLSHNIGSLVRVFLDRVSRIKSQGGQSTNPYYVFQTFNALYLLRSICKSYVENSPEDKLVKSFRALIEVNQASERAIKNGPQTPKTPAIPPPPPPPMQYQQQQHNTMQSQQSPYMQQESQQTISPSSSEFTTNGHQTNNDTNQPKEQAPPRSNVTGASTESNITIPSQSTIEQQPKPDFTSGSTMLDQFISTLVAIIVDIPLTDSTYLLQVETINTLLVLLSVQMYSSTPANQSLVYKCLMHKKCSIHALILTKTLLKNFMKQEPVPEEAGSLIIGLASGLWNILTFGYGAPEEEVSDNIPTLAKHSLLLLNVLTNHYTNEKNPYREAIVSCQDSRFDLSDPQMAFENANNDALATATTSKSALMSNSIKVDFGELYETICKNLHDDQVALLLYLLLRGNAIFKSYILTTTTLKLEKLLLPMLKVLYSSIEKGSHHIYMVLIIFIILSEEVQLNESIHKITIRGVPWYKDRLLSEISLGSLTALIIVRSFQYNIFRVKDKFLHTNLFATLGNISNYFQNLHPYVCQRIVDLLERLTKRYLAATKHLYPDNSNHHNLNMLHANNPLARALATDTKQDLQDASSIELDTNNAININIPTDNNPGQQKQQNSSNTALMIPPVDIHGQGYATSESSGQQSPNSNSNQDQVNITMEDTKQDLNLLEEAIRMILDVINNTLSNQLRSNPDLVYTLLYKREIFSSLLSSHQSFYEIVISVERILTFFYNKIENYNRQLSVEEIKELIANTSKDYHFNQNSSEPKAKLLFRYVEDDQPEEFFIPYIWTQIYYSSGIVWNSKNIVLFNPGEM